MSPVGRAGRLGHTEEAAVKLAIIWAWVISTPLGGPVVPEV